MGRRLPSAPPLLPGLDFVRPLGSGGFADVFLYQQDMPRRGVAVKVLPGGVSDQASVRMFNAEADILASLSAHPSIVTVYQAGISADGRPYIVMEYCPDSLAQRYRVERLPIADVLAVGVRLASALESAHRAGLIHRDIKPSNILITSFGAAVLADFGISSSLTKESADAFLAMSVPWSAPEVISGRTGGTVTSEVWSLGATVYSLIAGHSPFERRERGQNTRDLLSRRIARATYTPISRGDVPDVLQTVLATAMNRDPEARYASAREFGEALQQVQHDIGILATPLEIPSAEWAPTSEPLDLSDVEVRGGRRSRVNAENRRSIEATTTSQRPEDDIITSDKRRPRWPWIAGGAAAAAVVAIAGLGTALEWFG